MYVSEKVKKIKDNKLKYAVIFFIFLFIVNSLAKVEIETPTLILNFFLTSTGITICL
jgi:hypothetical protein